MKKNKYQKPKIKEKKLKINLLSVFNNEVDYEFGSLLAACSNGAECCNVVSFCQ
jgi:hypothetical protein